MITKSDLVKVLQGVVDSTAHAKGWLEAAKAEPEKPGDYYAHVDFADPYYRDNLLCLLEALTDVGVPVDTGDWFGEYIIRLKEGCGGDSNGANRNLAETKEMLLEWAAKVECKKQKSTQNLKCTDCQHYDKAEVAAKWIRCTQFAGDHLFCLKHAKMQKDFLEPGNFYWTSQDKEGNQL